MVNEMGEKIEEEVIEMKINRIEDKWEKKEEEEGIEEFFEKREKEWKGGE